MKFKFTFFLLLLFSLSTYAQVPDSLSGERGDTLETIISDTSIIYVIQAAPVTVREKVEIVQTKEKKKYYQSIDFSLLQFSEYKKAAPSFETYSSKVKASTNDALSYSLGTSLWQCPKKIYTGIGIDFVQLIQKFKYTDLNGQNGKTENRFNYTNFGVQLGYWFKKDKKISCIVYGKACGQYLISYSGFTLSKADPSIDQRLTTAMKYQKYLADFSLNFKFLFDLKTLFLGAEPYCGFSPISATPKNEAYSVKRSYLGIKIGITQKLFKL